MAVIVTLGTKIRPGYPGLKCGKGFKCGQPYRVIGKRVPGAK